MTQKAYRHFEFLDGMRFFCALWVVFSHLEFVPVLKALAPWMPPAAGQMALVAQKYINFFFNGSAAVVAFFIISGFCIHYPYASGKTLAVTPFYLARGTRIGLPIVVATLLAYQLPNGPWAIGGVLWSLYAEVIYYAIYPLLRQAFQRFGMRNTILASSVISCCMVWLPDPNQGYLWCYGVAGTWLLCLPMWLLGCLIAESVGKQRYRALANRPMLMPALRLLVVLVIWPASVLHAISHPIPLKYTMLLFSPLCAVWIYFEFLQDRPFSLFVKFSRLGSACFSIYLMHILVPLLLGALWGVERTALAWPLMMVSVIILSSLFYFLVERPSHLWSKKLAKRGAGLKAGAGIAIRPEAD
jgi:peptidoglycan/LPS O-acetylase OafA/YrhL